MPVPDVDRVAVVIGRTRHKMIVVELEEAAKRGAQFIELRLDFLSKAVDFKRLAPHKRCPWLATFRRVTEGGRHPCTEDERLAVMRQAIASGHFEWADLETDVADGVKRFGKVRRLISYHNMKETPEDLDSIYERMLRQDGDVYKLAVMTNTVADVERVLKIQKHAPKPTIIFGMGDLGLPTRYTALKYGAPWIYAAFNRERGIAPGLPAFDDFKTTYPVRSINASTEFFGVLGDPVGHSFSPVLHNHMYLRNKTNAIYLPFRVTRGTLAEALKVYEAVPVSGFSVTIPHKEDAATLATEKEAFVQLSGAANTLVRRPNGEFFAANTDYVAAIESLKANLLSWYPDGDAPALNQLSAIVLGTGGVARAIAHALHKEGVHLTIAARNMDKGAAIADEVHCKVVDWQGRHNVSHDIVINCTPVGMHPNVNESPYHKSALTSGKIIFDTIYNPETTLLVREARENGCKVITGVDMFVRQAARQIELFTQVVPNVEKMREIMRKALSPITRALEEEADDAEGDD
ncbi:shikimate dehydrogenase [Limnoglobus roseus]|uniref:Shikimate dehydrogenase (NADP(+)) n=1 Tax=Limnoglobus roseus TaxID=2598579 RepID=A0A5C1ACI2_9BACT|nr:shikimate dehydrogenase [Limnoglobus roseus]QEL15847.1 shikimate dehydrogenase [Limnoglobus roseus]